MQTPDTGVLILRLVLAGFLGGLIGAEREYRAKVAGMRTHLLVAIGAALMLIVSRYGFGGQGDPSRVAAQIVSGIGFIGGEHGPAACRPRPHDDVGQACAEREAPNP